MSRNIVPRIHKGSDLGTSEKNWNKLFADAVILRGNDLQILLDGKTDLDTLTAKGDLYVATDAGVITRFPAGPDGYVLKSNSGTTEGLMWGPAGARQELTNDITVTVGDVGDFPTINAALENIVSLYYPKYISGGNCPRVTINLLTGFVMAEQILIESLDLSWITITGNDAETVINRNALTNFFEDGYPAFGVSKGGFLPIISQLFNMDSSGDAARRHGILAFNNSNAIVTYSCGMKNAGGNGIVASWSSIINISGTGTASSADASGAGAYGIYATQGSTINASYIDASNAGNYGIYATQGSTINASYANASGAGTYGICASQSSTINAYQANISGAGTYGIYADKGSTINACEANALEAGVHGIRVNDGSIISAVNATGILSQTANTVTSSGIIFQ